MSWIRTVEGRHGCDLPGKHNAYARRGSVWQCDDCGQYWLGVREAAYDIPWRRISDRRGRRIARRETLKRGVA